MARRRFLAVLALALGLASGANANGYKSMARELSRQAQRQGIGKIAVLPFVPTDGSNPGDGWSISERLVTQLVRTGRVVAVERAMLERIMEEHYLARTGIVDPSSVRNVGRVLAVEAVVTGSFVNLGREVTVNARLIHVETGVVLAAAQRNLPREWFDSRQGLRDPFISFPRPSAAQTLARLAPPAPALPAAPGFLPVLDLDEREGLRDSLAEDSCAGAAERALALERSILDLKARFWASQIREGLEPLGGRGPLEGHPELRRELDEKINSYSAAGAPELSEPELRQFMLANERAFRLQRTCGITPQAPLTMRAVSDSKEG